jgi:hypothetical protein
VLLPQANTCRRDTIRGEVIGWRRVRCKPHAQAPCTPGSGLSCEDSGYLRTAILAGVRVGELPRAEFVPVALDHTGSALRAIRAAAFAVVHVTRIDVVQAVCERDAPSNTLARVPTFRRRCDGRELRKARRASH